MVRPSFVNVLQGSSSSGSQTHVETQDNEDEHLNSNDETVVQLPNYNANVVDNNMHPLFLYNNDHPGLILISKKLIGPDNYVPWSRSMQIALNARNKFILVNGLYKKPALTSPLCAQWERVNDMIITWILNSVADEISDGLNYVTTASEIWTELYERFSSVNGHRVYQIMKDTHSLEQGNRSVETYFHKLKSLWDEYAVLEPTVSCVCGAHKILVERDQKRKLLQFLMGLHDSNANVRGQILLMNPLLSVSQAYAYVKQDERARQGYQSLTDLSPLVNSAEALRQLEHTMNQLDHK
ncbi:uncharacterized protein LOC141686078 [Apium graveolens]|uniref:uncharacterized protein LOC141686078 n=1 Tax=Apium graveolens TaxID=4045 RepID=UPI003D7A8CD6